MSTWRSDLIDYIKGSTTYHLTAESPQAIQPAWIRTALRPHQLTLLSACKDLEAKASIENLSLLEPQMLTKYGVIADRVGAGKSLVALSLIREPPVKQAQFIFREGGAARILSLQHMPSAESIPAEWMDLSGQDLRSRLIQNNRGIWYSTSSLIIVPHNVVSQWESYIKEHAQLNAIVIKKTKDCDYDRPRFLQDVLNTELVVVSCTMLRKFMGAVSMYGPLFRDIVWSRVFIDEADTIPCTLRPHDVSARFFWFITGSWLNMLFTRGLHPYTIQTLPNDVRNTIGDGMIAGVANTMNVVAHSVSESRDPRFASLILRNQDSWVDASLLRPPIVHDTVLCRAPANLGILRDFISPAALEALHAGDTAGALAAMGLKAASKETLAERVTASLRGDLIQAEKILAFKREIEYSTPAAKISAVEKAEAKVTRIREQLSALETRIAGAATGELCPICYESPRTTTLTPCCRQSFCLACICECVAAKPICPMCRQSIPSPKTLMVIGSSDPEGGIDVDAIDQLPTKGAALLNLLRSSTTDQRFLVFSAHEASFAGLRELLAVSDIRCEMLSGTGARVDRLRRQFRDGTVRVLCMNARHVGAGINLEAATHVVLYHKMNTELERQVIGRAVRFERAAELRVVHMVHEQETAFNGATGSEVIVHL